MAQYVNQKLVRISKHYIESFWNGGNCNQALRSFKNFSAVYCHYSLSIHMQVSQCWIAPACWFSLCACNCKYWLVGARLISKERVIYILCSIPISSATSYNSFCPQIVSLRKLFVSPPLEHNRKPETLLLQLSKISIFYPAEFICTTFYRLIKLKWLYSIYLFQAGPSTHAGDFDKSENFVMERKNSSKYNLTNVRNCLLCIEWNTRYHYIAWLTKFIIEQFLCRSWKRYFSGF